MISSNQFAKSQLRFSTTNDVNINHDKLIFGSTTFPLDLYSCSLYALTEDPAHAALVGSISPLTVENPPFSSVEFDCFFAKPDDSIWIVGSCNGLVCVSISTFDNILWNPTTQNTRFLPESGTYTDSDNCSITHGFGYDELHDDYKVVELFYEHEASEFKRHLKVYSMRINSWKILLNWPGWDAFDGQGMFLNGSIHWAVCDFDRPAGWVIVSYILATDSFVELPRPKFDDSDVWVILEILQGCLAMCFEHNVHMDVRLMKEYGVIESWTKVVRTPYFLDFRDHEFVTRHCSCRWMA